VAEVHDLTGIAPLLRSLAAEARPAAA